MASSAAVHVSPLISRRRAYLSLGLGVFAIGWSAILVRWAGTAGMVSAFYRLAFAWVVFSETTERSSALTSGYSTRR